MRCWQKLLLIFIVWGLVLCYGITVTTALTSQEIAKTALGSTVHLGFIDGKGDPKLGSGFVVRNGQIATNYHVIKGTSMGFAKLVGKEDMYVIEEILSVNEERDLAIVKVIGIHVPALSLGDSDAVQIGDRIYVAGNPRGLEGSFSDGIISAIRGDATDKVFQMTAPISQGSSGGPVFNEKGEVIGISFATFLDGQNLNFAIPVNYLKPMVIMPVDPPPADSKGVEPPVNPPKPPEPSPSQKAFEKGIKLYEQAKYSEAIKTLNSALRELEDPKQQARAYLYLGCAKWGIGESKAQVKDQFQAAIRHNPEQKLPPRIGKDHPIFAELLEEIRKEWTGELTVISLLPQTEIWIDGNGVDRKMLGTGIVNRRLLKGNYTVEGIYEGVTKRKVVEIEPNYHKELDLEIPPLLKHDSPSRISIGEAIPLTLNLISSQGPQEVAIYYTIYDSGGNGLEQSHQKMRLWDKQPASSTWIYKAGLPPQRYIGLIEYHIEVKYENHLKFRHPETENRYYQISIVDDIPPTIELQSPPEGAKFTVNQQITIRAEVIDNDSVKEVRIHFLPFNGRKLSKEASSNMYTIDVTFSRAGSLQYHVTAIDEAGNKSKSESRHIDIRLGAGQAKAGLRAGVKDAPEDTHGELALPIYQGISASVSFDWDERYMFKLAYLSEGKTHPTLGAGLDFSYPDRTNVNAMFQWGPALGESNVAFALLAGIAEYEDFPASGPSARSTHITPLLGAGLKLYPLDKIVIDATSSIKLRSDYDTTDLYHYEVGIRFYITRELSLKAEYGKLYLGNRNVTIMRFGLGYTF